MFLLTLLGGVILLRIGYTGFCTWRSPLRSIPGPFTARFTKLWYFWRLWLGNFEQDNINLHRKYGPIIRIAPDMYSIDDPTAARSIYGASSKMTKAAWYEGWRNPGPEPIRWELFTERDLKRHAENKKTFHALYNMSNILCYEKHVDECIDMFMQQMSRFAELGEEIDLQHWFQCFAFDVIGKLTYSERFGFLDHGEDVFDIIKTLTSITRYSTLIGLYPSLHKYFYKILAWLCIGGATGRNHLALFSRMQIREKERKRDERGPLSKNENQPIDFVDKLLAEHEKNPEKVTSHHVFRVAFSNIFAGADTTAISISAVMYFLLRHPNAMKKLRAEIDERMSGGLPDNHAPFKESSTMPYLQAVIKEALRLHSATGLPLWRDITQGSLDVDGHLLPKGAVVGLNSWVAHYNEDVFGKDATSFRPERWTEVDDNSEDLRRMNSYYLPFGLGSYACLGRHISMLEISKIIPRLVTNFDLELMDCDQGWKVRNYWFVRPLDFFVKVKLRERYVGSQRSCHR